MPKRHLITAALPYANGPVHIGHLAGCYLPADIYVRYLRQKNEDVLFICGSDEHGVPITLKAKKENTTPQAIVDRYHEMMGNAFQNFGIAFNYYGRTSSPTHHQTASDFFQFLYDKHAFVEEITEHYFDEAANQFLADRYITGTCPSCQNPNAYGDQCEKCGKTLSPQELIEPKSALSGNTPILKPTRNWFLPLDQLQPQIESFISSRKDWKTNVAGQVRSWLHQGLQARAMTRDLSWGVPVPSNIPDSEGKVLYVWFDAPIGYISATKEYFEKIGKPNDWEKYWKSEESRLIHFIGKDNIVFHCIIFPAMLMQHGGYILPENVPANEFLNLEGDKISTSRNHAVWLHEYLEDFPGKQDELRYVLTSIAPETKDSDFSWKDFQQKVNSELVAILGNFVNRVLVLTHKYYGGVTPNDIEITNDSEERSKILAAYRHCHEEGNAAISKMMEYLDQYKFREAQAEMMNLVRCGNKFLAETEPWKLQKSDPVAVEAILSYALALVGNIACACEPFLPHTSAKIFDFLQPENRKEILLQFWNEKQMVPVIPVGHTIAPASLLFEHIEDAAMDSQREKLHQRKSENESSLTKPSIEPAKPEINYEDFSKVDLRIATILEAERVPKTDKLMKLSVDTGLDQRTIVSGIAHQYNPEELIGKQIMVLTNLAPRKLKGIESQGMILLAKDPEGNLIFVSPVSPTSNGSEVA
jgi:methionyl-tRNA synthetase